MNLLLLDQFSDLGGAQQVLLELLPAIRARGWNGVLAAPGNGPMFARARALGFCTEPIDCGPYHSGKKTAGDVARFAIDAPRLALQIRRMARPDLIYVNGPRLLPAVALSGVSAAVVFHSHSYVPRGAMRWLAGESLRRTRAWTVGCCEFVARPWRAFAPDRVTVVYNGVAGAPAANRNTTSFPRVGCIGRIAPEKGQLEFLEAAGLIHRALPQCRFRIHGSPVLAEPAYAEQVYAAARGLPAEFPGWSADIYDALAELDLLLVPSAPHEATTRVILEAFSAGVPVIAFPNGGIPEVIDDRQTGYFAASPSEMAQTAIDLLSGPPGRLAAVAAAALESWSQRFTLARFHEELLALLARVADPESA